MGNVQASSIANQLLPCESYINDVPALKFSNSLGSTRFMKVARAEHARGPVVIKVFVPTDQSFSIAPYRDQVLQILSRLRDHLNCCPFRQIFITPRCAILSRPYAKYTLYNRLSTRPLLLDVERRWVVYQLLKALSQCRIGLVCHGDIKSENVLVTSSLWVYLADFAPFKPAFLPYDNPSTFTFFFDTSRQRTCNLAPERFKRSDEINYAPRFPNDTHIISEGLTEAMDIFAMGCVIAEVLMDERKSLFTLPAVIDYNRVEDETAARRHVARLLHDANVPEEFHRLLAAMLERDPTCRREEFYKLAPCNSILFPRLFEQNFYDYFRSLHDKPDELITKLFVERDNYLPLLRADEAGHECTVLFVNYVTSNVRACRSLSAKMDGISLLLELSQILPAIIGDRIVPYLTHLVSDTFPQVRVEAIFVLVEVLAKFEPLVQEDCRLIIDFVLPKLKTVTLDSSNYVKSALAGELGKLAMISLRYFNEGIRKLREESAELKRAGASKKSSTGGGSSAGSSPPTSGAAHATATTDGADELDSEKLLIQSERTALHDAINELFVNLCGSENEVRQSLFEAANLDLLCTFGGPERAIDILMHMITVLNDKPDWRMRATFYGSCPVVAHHLGQFRCGKLLPFLQQGLQDNQEFVVFECLCCIHVLCDRQLLSRAFICEIMRDVAPFLVHPNLWLRTAVANILVIFQSTFNIADLYCKITPLVRPFFTREVIVYSKVRIILEELVEPIPRLVWDYLIGYKHIREFIDLLENDRTLVRLSGTIGDGAESSAAQRASLARLSLADDVELNAIRQKLANVGLDSAVEEKILALKNVLCNVNFVERGSAVVASTSHGRSTESFSKIYLDKFPRVRRRVYDMETEEHRVANNANCLLFRDFLGSPSDSSISSSGDAAGRAGGGALLGASQPITASDSAPAMRSATRRPANDRTASDVSTEFVTTSGTTAGQKSSSVTLFQLNETLSHKRQVYLEQKRITAAESVHKIALQIANAMAEDGTRRRVKDAIGAESVENGGESARRVHGHRANPFTMIDASATPSFGVGAAAFGEEQSGDGAATAASGRFVGVRLCSTAHEHTEKITGLTLHPDKDIFASCSRDGYVKLWSVDALLGNSRIVPPAISRNTVRYGRPFNCCAFSPITGHLALASTNGVLQVCDEHVSRVLSTYNTAVDAGTAGNSTTAAAGDVTQLHCYGNLIYAITHHSAVYVFDPRATSAATRSAHGTLTPVWCGQLKESYGLITSFCVDPISQHWALFTSSSATTKNMILWDLRFDGLESCAWSNANAHGIVLNSWALASGGVAREAITNCSKEGEVSLWDLATQTRTDVFWPSVTPPLVYTNDAVSTSLTPSCVDPELIFTGDSEGALRCWNLRHAELSSYLCGPYRKYAEPDVEAAHGCAAYRVRYTPVKYRENLLRVQAERRDKLDVAAGSGRASAATREHHPAVDLRPTDYHHDSVTNLLSLWPDLLVSSDREGVIKLWKTI